MNYVFFIKSMHYCSNFYQMHITNFMCYKIKFKLNFFRIKNIENMKNSAPESDIIALSITNQK